MKKKTNKNIDIIKIATLKLIKNITMTIAEAKITSLMISIKLIKYDFKWLQWDLINSRYSMLFFLLNVAKLECKELIYNLFEIVKYILLANNVDK